MGEHWSGCKIELALQITEQKIQWRGLQERPEPRKTSYRKEKTKNIK